MQRHTAMLACMLLGLALPVAAASANDTGDLRAKTFDTYNKIEKALENGQRLSVVVHFNACDQARSAANGHIMMARSDNHGGLPIHDFMILPDHIAFSLVHQTVDPNNNIVYEFNRYKVSPAGTGSTASAKVEMSTYSWKTGDTQATPGATYTCDTGGGGVDFTG
ncbi:VirK family protein [Dyella flagellata]|uniref:VirK protein n=1 Tax=Dyella flagellata TaxID=1867833 RepID=A0ABQ5X7F1_9GAMM|nr:VirK family protein [Dyella flagellata]GLQ86599.1 hypothetical protein GCM10007898_01650 [Dyella flagellata]